MDAKLVVFAGLATLATFTTALFLTPAVESLVRAPRAQSTAPSRIAATSKEKAASSESDFIGDGKTVGMVLSLCVVPTSGAAANCAREFVPVEFVAPQSLAKALKECERDGWRQAGAGVFASHIQADGSEVRPAFESCTYRDGDNRQPLMMQ